MPRRLRIREVPSNGVVEISLLPVRTGETSIKTIGPVTAQKPLINTLHGALENGADLRVNERQKIRHYRARSTEERRRIRRRREEGEIAIFLLRARDAYVKFRYIAILYTHSIGNQPRTRWWCLKCVIVYLARAIQAFVMYCVNGTSGSSLLIESTNSMIQHLSDYFIYIYLCVSNL